MRRRRKPDLMWILGVVFTLGVVTTGYTQSYFERPSAAAEAGIIPSR